MPANSDDHGPWGPPSGSSGNNDGRRPSDRPASDPWGQNSGGNGDPDKDRRKPDNGTRRPHAEGPFGSAGRPNGGSGSSNRGPFGGRPFGGGQGSNQGGGPFGGPPPDIDRLIAQAQGFIRRLAGGLASRGSGSGGSGSGGSGSGGRRPRQWLAGIGGSNPILLAGIVIVLLWAGSGFYRVQPDEQGVVLRFGAYRYWTPPGLHWHVPWPVEAAQTPTVTRINRTEIGYRSMPGAGQIESGREAVGQNVLAESLMLTGDENIIDIDFAVFWRVSNAPDFLFNTANPEALARAVAESSMREVIGRTPIQPALTQARAQIEADVLKQTQDILDRYQAGIEVTQVQLQRVDPPDAVIESFRDVQRANTDAERMRNEAEAYRNDIVPRARGDAARVVAEAQGAKAAASAQATGQAQRFDSVLKAYQAAKDVTLQRMYLDTMQDVLGHSQTLVVDDKLKNTVPYLPLTPPLPQPSASAPTAGANAASAPSGRGNNTPLPPPAMVGSVPSADAGAGTGQ